jgi:hypothetical protein
MLSRCPSKKTTTYYRKRINRENYFIYTAFCVNNAYV